MYALIGFSFIGFDLHAAIVQKPIEDSYLRVIRYETATEAEDRMIETALPKVLPPSLKKSNLLKNGSYL
jgi:hypothetical protein